MISVGRLSVAPVKGLALQHPDSIELTDHGVRDDRRFFFIDDGNRVVDGLLAGPLVKVGAWADSDGSCLRITLPDGEVVQADVTPSEQVEIAMYSRRVVGHLIDGPWAEALSPLAGRNVRLVRTD